VLGLKPCDPGINGGPGHLQKAADTQLIPALIVEFDDLEACLIAVGMGMVGPQFQLLLRGHGTLLPQEFRRLVIERIGALTEDNPCQFPIMKATIESFEAVNLLADIVGDGAGTPTPSDLDIAREEPQHPLLAEASMERPDRFRMRSRFLGSLRRGPIGKEHQRANDLVAPLSLIDQAQLQLGKRGGGVHSSPFSLWCRRGVM
jgi:hypothetical protein